MKRTITGLVVCLMVMFLPITSNAVEVRTGTLSGKFKIPANMPMDEGLVYIYNLASGPAPSKDRYWRIPDNVILTDKDGYFSTELLAGDYCVGAVKRKGPKHIGPPQVGDLFTLSLDSHGKPKIYSLKVGEKIDLGILTGTKTGNLKKAKGLTVIEGTIEDYQGKKVKGTLVLAFITPVVIGKPLFVSDRSSKDGRFSLRVHEGGIYYLKVRNSYGGGPPEAGAVLDGKREEPLVPVFVKTGESVRNVLLKGQIFSGRGREKE